MLKIKREFFLSFCSFLLVLNIFYSQNLNISQDDVLHTMEKVADWQLSYPIRFDITVSTEDKTKQYSILWDGTFVRYREREDDSYQYDELGKDWRYLGKLVGQNVSFSEMPLVVQNTFVNELQLEATNITKIEMCDKDTKGWETGAFFVGLEALAKVSNDKKYIEALKLIGEANDWKLGDRIYHADDHCVGQMYLYLYSIYNDLNMLANVQMQFDWIIKNPHPQSLDYSEGKNRWSWCDALFMSPPVWVLLTNVTGDEKYFNYMNNQFWQTTEHLYDKEEHLFYRDDRYYKQREANGEKVFWSRGNGWVVSGLARIIENFPEHGRDKEKYVNLFKEMMTKIKTIQPDGGLFRASLLDTQSHPIKEASGTAFFTYAAAWGVNNGILDKNEFLLFIKKSWEGLQMCVNNDGKLGWTQLPGSEPGDVKEEYNAPYGVGAFLLAGSEIYKLTLAEKQ